MDDEDLLLNFDTSAPVRAPKRRDTRKRSARHQPYTKPAAAEAREAGVAVSVAHAQERGRDAVGDLLEHAERVGASRIVVGVKHRSPVGKLLLGSAAQQIILEARVPVVCVKP